MITLTPAYGRDYTSKAKAIADLEAGKDFIINAFGHRYDGKPCSLNDLKGEGVKSVMVRYKGLRNVTVYKIK